MLKHSVAMRVWLGHLADPAALREIVEAHRAYTDEMLAEVTRGQPPVGGYRPRPGSIPELVERWGERYWAAERDLADSMLRDLRDAPELAAEERSPYRRSRSRAGEHRPGLGEQRVADEAAGARTPGGTAKIALPVCLMYSFSASFAAEPLLERHELACAGRAGSTRKNSPASSWPVAGRCRR